MRIKGSSSSRNSPVAVLGLILFSAMALFGVVEIVPAWAALGVLWTLIAVSVAAFWGWVLWRGLGSSAVADVQISPGAGPRLVSPSEGLTPQQRLARLDDMRQKGLVNEQEYAEQRRRILNSL